MRKKGLVSIIIPVHNSEKYVDQIFKNVIKQKYPYWELIIIDDHSIDNTINLLNARKKNVNQKIVIKESHGFGVSAARNTGINSLSGKYVAFVDADDELTANYLNVLVSNMENYKTDITMCSYYELTKNTRSKRVLPWSGLFDTQEEIKRKVIPRLIFNKKNERQVWLPVWRTLINTRFLRKSNILFNEGISQAEDFLFLLELLMVSKRICFVSDRAEYYYKRRSNSAMNVFIINNLEQQKKFHIILVNVLKQYGIYNDVELRYLSNKASMYSKVISNATHISQRNKAIHEIKRVKYAYFHDERLNRISIFKLYNSFFVKIALFLLKNNFLHLLYLIYYEKEKIRLNKLE